jgi:hypothetical protein
MLIYNHCLLGSKLWKTSHADPWTTRSEPYLQALAKPRMKLTVISKAYNLPACILMQNTETVLVLHTFTLLLVIFGISVTSLTLWKRVCN